MSFGENLMRIRKEKGVTRKELAERLGVPYTTLRNYEKGSREPGHKTLITLSQMFDVSVDDLIGNAIKHDVQSPRQAAEITPHEMNLIHAYRKANQDSRFIVDMALKSGKVLENEVWVQLKDRSYLKPLFQKLRERPAKAPAFDAVSSKSRYYVWSRHT